MGGRQEEHLLPRLATLKLHTPPAQGCYISILIFFVVASCTFEEYFFSWLLLKAVQGVGPVVGEGGAGGGGGDEQGALGGGGGLGGWGGQAPRLYSQVCCLHLIYIIVT